MKKNNLPKIIIAAIVIIIVIAGVLIGDKFISSQKTVGKKTITITIENQVTNQTLLKDKTFHTNATTLAEFLNENKKELKVDMVKQAPYGDYLLGFYGLKTTNMSTGPWWTYSYSAPSQKLDYKIGYAPAIDQINLAQSSSMTFVFTKSF